MFYYGCIIIYFAFEHLYIHFYLFVKGSLWPNNERGLSLERWYLKLASIFALNVSILRFISVDDHLYAYTVQRTLINLLMSGKMYNYTALMSNGLIYSIAVCS